MAVAASVRKKEHGFTLLETLVAIGIALLLLAFSAPFIINSRGRSSVNHSVVLTKAWLEDTAEAAKTNGLPLDQNLRETGLIEEAKSQTETDTTLWLRRQRRGKKGEPLELLTQVQLSNSDSTRVTTTSIGFLDIEADTEQEGLFVELVERGENSTKVLATIPVDMNGEFLLQGPAGGGTIRYSHGDYSRELAIRVQGTASLDRR